MLRYKIQILFINALCFTLLSGLVSGCASGPAKRELTHEERARLLLDVANGALIEGDPTGALATLIQARQEDPKLPGIYQAMALAYYTKDNLPEALEHAKIAVRLAPHFAEGNNTLGKILLDMGRYSEAVGPLTEAAENSLYRDAFKAATNLGILYYRKGDLTKASEYFQKAIDEGGDDACIAYYYRGHLKLREADYSDAIRDYQLATRKACGGFADAHLAIAITYERTKQYDMARRGFVAIEQRFPNSKAADQAIAHLRNLP